MTDKELQNKRFIAAGIDIAIAIAIGVAFALLGFVVGFAGARSSGSSTAIMYVGRVLGFLGALVSVGYMLGRDVLGGGRSIGKKIQNINVVTTAGHPITFMDSAKRNVIYSANANGTITLPEGVEMVMPGDNITMDVTLIVPIAMEEKLRFAIREGGRTVGAGVVAKIL